MKKALVLQQDWKTLHCSENTRSEVLKIIRQQGKNINLAERQ